MSQRLRLMGFALLLALAVGAGVGVGSSASAAPSTPPAALQPAALGVITIGPYPTREQCLETTQKVFEAGKGDYVGYGCVYSNGKWYGQLFYNFPGCRIAPVSLEAKLAPAAC